MERSFYLLTIGNIVAALLLTGCGSSSVGLFHKSPSDTVKAFYMTANQGKYSEVEKLLSTDTLNLIKRVGQLGGGLKGICDMNTRNGTITEVEILNEEIRGEGATVIARIHFKGGATKENDRTPLIKENGVWKIAAN